jgi:hypothetical protein
VRSLSKKNSMKRRIPTSSPGTISISFVQQFRRTARSGSTRCKESPRLAAGSSSSSTTYQNLPEESCIAVSPGRLSPQSPQNGRRLRSTHPAKKPIDSDPLAVAKPRRSTPCGRECAPRVMRFTETRPMPYKARPFHPSRWCPILREEAWTRCVPPPPESGAIAIPGVLRLGCNRENRVLQLQRGCIDAGVQLPGATVGCSQSPCRTPPKGYTQMVEVFDRKLSRQSNRGPRACRPSPGLYWLPGRTDEVPDRASHLL